MLGVTALAEQVTRLTEAVNSIMGTQGKTTPAAPMAGVNPFIAQLMQTLGPAIPGILSGIMGGGEASKNPFADVDKELVESVMKETRERAIMEKEAMRAMRDEIIAGKKIFRNAETGDIIIANPTGKKVESPS